MPIRTEETPHSLSVCLKEHHLSEEPPRSRRGSCGRLLPRHHSSPKKRRQYRTSGRHSHRLRQLRKREIAYPSMACSGRVRHPSHPLMPAFVRRHDSQSQTRSSRTWPRMRTRHTTSIAKELPEISQLCFSDAFLILYSLLTVSALRVVGWDSNPGSCTGKSWAIVGSAIE